MQPNGAVLHKRDQEFGTNLQYELGKNEMIKDITVCCEQGQIKVSWKWDSEEIEKVRITYKKKDSSDGDGIGFGEVSRIPHMEIGSQTRALRGEQGLYTFTFLPGRKEKVYKPMMYFSGKGLTLHGRERRQGKER